MQSLEGPDWDFDPSAVREACLGCPREAIIDIPLKALGYDNAMILKGCHGGRASTSFCITDSP